MGLCAGMGKAGSRSNPGQNAAIPIGIALKILVSAARCQRKARLWNRYPRKTVKPSFEPQPTSLMLKKRFLRRSGHKYEKSCSFGHGVSWGLAKNMCQVCANCKKSRQSAKKCENRGKIAKNSRKNAKKREKMRKVAKKARKKRQLMGWSASYGVPSYWRMYCKIKRLRA